MKLYRNTKISSKLILGFLTITLIGASLALFSMYNMQILSNSDKRLYEVNTMAINYSGSAGTYFQRIRYLVIEMTTLDQKDDRDKNILMIKEFVVKIDDLLLKYGQTITGDEKQSALYKKLLDDLSNFKYFCNQIYQAEEVGNMEKVKQILLVDADTTIMSMRSQFEYLTNYNAEIAAKASQQNQMLNQRTISYMWCFFIVGLMLSISLGIFIAKSISKPIQILVQSADKIAAGDINVKVDLDREDEIGQLYYSFAKMIENISNQAYAAEKIAGGDLTVEVMVHSEDDLLGKKLYEVVHKNNELLSKIAAASDQVAIGANQVAESSIALSQGAMEQSDMIQTLNTAVEQMARITKLNTEESHRAEELLQEELSVAILESERADDIVEHMNKEDESYHEILQQLKKIDEIIFQMNILSLDAVVAAAAAGEYGVEMAAIAEKVRRLTAGLARQIKAASFMFNQMIEKVEENIRIEGDLSEDLHLNVRNLETAVKIVKDISLRLGGYEERFERINQSINRVSEVIQSVEATSVESASSSEELSIQAIILREAVSKYKLRKMDNFIKSQEKLNPEVWSLLEKMQRDKRRYYYKSSVMEEIASAKSNIHNQNDKV